MRVMFKVIKMGQKKLTVLLTLVVLGTLAGIGGLVFVKSGAYDIAAIRPHISPVRFLLTTTKRNSIETHARNLKAPELRDAALIKRGLTIYRKYCVNCHGAPGEARSRIGIGLNPTPPPLEKAIVRWKATEIAWITAMGLKMAGMPAFGLGEQPGDLWAVTAFISRMNTLSPQDYRKMMRAEAGEPGLEVDWMAEGDLGWQALAERGSKQVGKRLLSEYGCGACHSIPGVRSAVGMTGPPLDDWANRHYIAGSLVNYPNNLVRWLMDPQYFAPRSAMPDLDVSEEDAWEISAYLYSLDQSGL